MNKIWVLILLNIFSCSLISSDNAKIKTLIDTIIKNQHISADSLESISDTNDLRRLRNTIFAKNGYTFQDKELENYFKTFAWYKPISNNAKIKISSIDVYNLDTIKSRETMIAVNSFLMSKTERKINSSESDFIGNWDTQPVSSSGYTNVHSFLKNGKIKISEDEMDCQKRLLAKIGDWKVEGSSLKINLTKKIIIEGGTLIESVGSCGSDYELEGGLIQFVDINPAEVLVYKIQGFSNSEFNPDTNDHKTKVQLDTFFLYKLPH